MAHTYNRIKAVSFAFASVYIYSMIPATAAAFLGNKANQSKGQIVRTIDFQQYMAQVSPQTTPAAPVTPAATAVVPAVAQPASPAGGSDAGIGVINPIVPVTPPSQSVMSLECEVPSTKLADRAPLPRLVNRLRKNSKPIVLAVGSSSTWGVGSSNRNKTYPAQLEAILEKAWKGKDVEVINRGVSGEVAAITAERLLTLAAEYRPDLVLWQLGTNDAVLRIPVNDFSNTVKSTVQKLKQSGIDVVLVGLQYTAKWARDKNYFAIRDALYKIAKEEKILYVRRYTAMEFLTRTHKDMDVMARDNFHLNDLGYQCMAEHIAQAVIMNLFVRKPNDPPAQK